MINVSKRYIDTIDSLVVAVLLFAVIWLPRASAESTELALGANRHTPHLLAGSGRRHECFACK
jgi:hypothetical protein